MPPPRRRPTDAELAILRVLWEKGPCTVRQIHDVLSQDRALGYTTSLKLLQIMTEKGLTTRETLGIQHVYTASLGEEGTQRQLLRDLIDRAFGGSMSKLVMQALAAKKASPEELREIHRLLAHAREKSHD
jgi:BlaI family penicillinase repressor